MAELDPDTLYRNARSCAAAAAALKQPQALHCIALHCIALQWKSGALGDFSATVLRHYCPVGTLCLQGELPLEKSVISCSTAPTSFQLQTFFACRCAAPAPLQCIAGHARISGTDVPEVSRVGCPASNLIGCTSTRILGI